MSIDTINMKGDYKDPTISVETKAFNIEHIEYMNPLTKSYRYKTEQEALEHFPTIHLFKHFYGIDLSFELSVGKFLNNNNIETIDQSDITPFVRKMVKVLKAKNICCNEQYLRNTLLSRYDACMVVDVSNRSACMTIMQTLAKVSLPQNIRGGKKAYPGVEFDGFQFVLGNKGKPEWRLVIYDKLAEVLATKKSRDEIVLVERDGHIIQTTVKEALEMMDVKQLLRIELQLLNPDAIKKQAERIGLDTNNLTLEALFDQKIACKMILDVWDRYITPHLSSGLMQRMKESSLKDKALKQGIPYPEIMRMLYYKHSCSLYQNGINDIRKEVPDENLRPYIIQAEKTFNKIPATTKTTIAKTFKYIRQCLEQATPFKFRV